MRRANAAATPPESYAMVVVKCDGDVLARYVAAGHAYAAAKREHAYTMDALAVCGDALSRARDAARYTAGVNTRSAAGAYAAAQRKAHRAHEAMRTAERALLAVAAELP